MYACRVAVAQLGHKASNLNKLNNLSNFHIVATWPLLASKGLQLTGWAL